MNGKEKFMFIMLLALYIGAFYYYAMTEELNSRMDELNLADKQHVDKVLGSYADSLHTYNLRFIGRGKHIRKAQKDIVANTDLIEKNTDSLAVMIDDVSFKLDNFTRETEKKFRNVNNDIDDLAYGSMVIHSYDYHEVEFYCYFYFDSDTKFFPN